MRAKRLTYVAIATAVLYAILIVAWHLYSPSSKELALQNPGADNRPESLARKADDVVIGEYFMQYEENFTTELKGIWSGFRGVDYTNIVSDGRPLMTEEFPEQWSFSTGEGHAAAAIYQGRAYVLDYEESLNSDALRCFSLETGKEIWRRWYRVPMKRNHGFSRTIPVVGEGYVITVGPQGHVMCCDPMSGDMKWAMDMQKEFGSEIPFWYTGQCPCVDDGVVVLAPAGESVLMIGLDCQTGEVVWQTPNDIKYKMSHSSIIPMTLNGTKTYVYAGVGGVCGVAATKAQQGKLLWHTEKWQPSVIAPSPVKISENRILMVAGYGSGGALIEVNGATANVVEQYKADKGLSCEQQTPILYKGLIYTIAPKDGGSIRGRLASYTPSNLHTPVWSSAADERFGLGPYIFIDNNLFIFKDDGELYVYDMQGSQPKLLRKQRIMEGADAWGPMAYADGRLILRDAHTVKCIKIK